MHARQSPAPRDPAKLLVIHFGQLGDVILGLPALDAIRARFPDIPRRVSGYKLPNCLRITVGDEPSCRRVAHAIGQFKGLK